MLCSNDEFSFGFANTDSYGGSWFVVATPSVIAKARFIHLPMASSSMFRGRRIVDPVPVQRGPLPREGNYRSSFSGNILDVEQFLRRLTLQS